MSYIYKSSKKPCESVLEKFQNERNREAEENFAKVFSENDEVKLFFINEDMAYTDGKIIVVDPGFLDIYKDSDCIKKTEAAMSLPSNIISGSTWNVLKMITRGLTLHECLHLIYTDFPTPPFSDSELNSRNKRQTAADIFNIIEDAYIEAVGASVYDNISMYLMFTRYAVSFAQKDAASTAERRLAVKKPGELDGYKLPANISVTDIEKTIEEQIEKHRKLGCENENLTAQIISYVYQKFELDKLNLSEPDKKKFGKFLKHYIGKKKLDTLISYLNYMTAIIDYPMFEYEKPESRIAEYVEKTRQLFLDACIAESPKGRYGYCKKIYQIILPLIPDDEEAEIKKSLLPKTVHGKDTHSNRNHLSNIRRSGQPQKVTTRLFVNLDGSKKDEAKKDFEVSSKTSANKKNINIIYTDDPQIIFLIKIANEFINDEKNVDDILQDKSFRIEHKAANFGASPVHRGIKINETHPKINFNMRVAYKNIYDKYRININSYNSRFLQLLKANVTTTENHFLFGSGISSKDLGDVKKRYWYKKQSGIDIPDLSVIFVLDGSGSMEGERRNSTMVACVILHEVLKKQNIAHAMVEHRARFAAPEVDINILLDFNAREEEKYNLMMLKAEDCNRDALALLWAERYINQKTYCDNKLIVIISDGEPNHSYDDYTPPISVKDTANTAKKIISRGTNIIAVSLDDADEFCTYENLKEIYPHIISCQDLKRLPAQLINIISKQLM